MVIGGNMKNFKLKSMLILLALVFSTVMFASCFDTDTEQANLNLAELKANDVVLTLSDGTYSHEVRSITRSTNSRFRLQPRLKMQALRALAKRRWRSVLILSS